MTDADQSPGTARLPDTPADPASADGQLGVGTIHYSAEQAGRAKEVLTRLQALRRAVRFYPMEHPTVRENVAALEQVLRTYFDEGVELQLAFFEGEILLGDQLLAEDSITFDQFIREMQEIGVGSLVFRPGLDEAELTRVAKILGVDAKEAEAAGGVTLMAEEAELTNVQIGLVYSAEPEFVGTEREKALHAFSQAVEFVEEADESLHKGAQVNPTKVRRVVRSLIDGVLSNRHSMLQLTGLKSFDEYTFYHSVNVAILSLALGSIVTRDDKFLSLLGTSALLHDIGKLEIGHDIINKPGQLSPEEWEAMQRHPLLGAEMVAMMPGLDPSAIVPVFEHHMRYDGSGYPPRVPPRSQNLMSRIVAVADAYDAMTSKRSYSAARVQDQAMSQLDRSAGTSLDPVLVRLFVNMLGVFPPRTIVRLSSGEVAIVVEPVDGEPLKPVVRVISSPTGELVDPFDIVLAQRDDLEVQSTLDPRLLNIDVDDYL